MHPVFKTSIKKLAENQHSSNSRFETGSNQEFNYNNKAESKIGEKLNKSRILQTIDDVEYQKLDLSSNLSNANKSFMSNKFYGGGFGNSGNGTSARNFSTKDLIIDLSQS